MLGLSTEYEGQYLTIEARAAEVPVFQEPLPEERDIDSLAELVCTFPERFEVKRRQWSALLEGYARDGKRAVIRGAGSKAVAFLSTLPGVEVFRYGVDINPYRQGHFLPGTALPIVGPDFLADYRPDAVAVLNPLYADEIRRDLQGMGLSPETLVDQAR